ncbi:MAG: 16S rRNA processing protein RimM [Alphaproteobacteria bacterium]|nr:16S rRNA processing protein RimM [Alphaproteobacteria bacterium]
MSQGANLVCVGCITAAHGIKGNVTVNSFTQIPEDFLSYGPLLTENGEKFLPLKILHPAKESLFVVQIEGISTREDAEKYKGLSLYVPRENFPEPEDDTYYHSDLIGLSVQDEKGTILGSIKEIHDFGAGVLLEIAAKDSLKTWMIPFQTETVPLVNIQGGYIALNSEGVKEWGEE